MPRTARPPPLAVAAIDELADDDFEATDHTTAQCAPAWDRGTECLVARCTHIWFLSCMRC
jgi:hypothetical protein